MLNAHQRDSSSVQQRCQVKWFKMGKHKMSIIMSNVHSLMNSDEFSVCACAWKCMSLLKIENERRLP